MSNATMAFNVLVKEEDDMWVAHCLELDVVATSDTEEGAVTDIADLIRAQVSYAISHDNLEYLYHPAPSEVWEEFLRCKERVQSRHEARPDTAAWGEATPSALLDIVANTCRSPRACHA